MLLWSIIPNTCFLLELRRRNVPPKATSPIALGASGTTISPGQTISLNSAAGPPNIFPMFHGKSPTNPPYPPAYYPRGAQPFGMFVHDNY